MTHVEGAAILGTITACGFAQVLEAIADAWWLKQRDDGSVAEAIREAARRARVQLKEVVTP